MTKTNGKQKLIDEMTLIKTLFNHGILSNAELEKKIRFSKLKIWRMMKTLEREKKIIGIHPVINEKKLGLNGYALLMKRSMSPMYKERLNSLLGPSITKKANEMNILFDSFSFVHGTNVDFILSYYASNLLHAIQFKNAVLEIFDKAIKEVTLIEILTPIIKNGLSNPDKKDLESYFP